jgi:GNAT superfamily N-acetyltransferase
LNEIIYKIAETPEEISAAKKLEHDVFKSVGFIDCSEKCFEISYYVRYELGSIFCIAKKNGLVIGVLRIIEYTENGYPVLNDFEIFSNFKDFLNHLPKGSIIEIGTVAVRDGYQRLGVARGLFKLAWQYSKEKFHHIWVAAIDERVFELLTRKYHFYFTRIGPPKYYLGSQTVPSLLDKYIQAVKMSQEFPEEWKFYNQGC